MSVGQALLQHLADDADVSAIVGAQIYRLTAKSSSTLPRVIVQKASNVGTTHLNGLSGLRRERWQFRCQDDQVTVAEDLGEKVRLAFVGVRAGGTIGSGSYTVAGRGLFLENDLETFTTAGDGTQAVYAEYLLDFFVWTTEVTS